MNQLDLRSAIVIGIALVCASAYAEAPPSAKKSPSGLGCPAANKVNSAAENALGCTFSLPRDIAQHWVPATKADFERQSSGRTFGEVKGQGLGGVRCVKFYKKKKGVTTSIHRVYGGQARDFGGYWTFQKFPTDQQTYRKKFAVCADWNDLSKSVECKLGPFQEMVIAVGPGESVGPRQVRGPDGKLACKNVCRDQKEYYPASSDLQVVLFAGDRFCNKG